MKPDESQGDWTELGFQGKDPTTDFRGMGLLGLTQLVHFSAHRSIQARNALLESLHPRRYFPFAATGINMTAFVVELLQETRLHATLFGSLERDGMDHFDIGSPSGSAGLVDNGCSSVHDVYCDLFEAFIVLWVKRDPVNVMAFPNIIGEFKDEARKKYRTL
jgi:ELMO domain-containing protein